jgi:hypothetical protein
MAGSDDLLRSATISSDLRRSLTICDDLLRSATISDESTTTTHSRDCPLPPALTHTTHSRTTRGQGLFSAALSCNEVLLASERRYRSDMRTVQSIAERVWTPRLGGRIHAVCLNSHTHTILI